MKLRLAVQHNKKLGCAEFVTWSKVKGQGYIFFSSKFLPAHNSGIYGLIFMNLGMVVPHIRMMCTWICRVTCNDGENVLDMRRSLSILSVVITCSVVLKLKLLGPAAGMGGSLTVTVA